MRVLKAIGIGLAMGIGGMFAVGFINVVLGVEDSVAGMIEGLVFMAGLTLGLVLVLKGDKPKPPRLTVDPSEWGKPQE
jgi:hypothetical protein